MSYTDSYDFQTPDSMLGFPRRDPPPDITYPPGDWGEAPAENALPYPIDPNAPRFIPPDPTNMIGQPPYFENIAENRQPNFGDPFYGPPVFLPHAGEAYESVLEAERNRLDMYSIQDDYASRPN